MTEAEWLSSSIEPGAMLEHLRGGASNRKLRLFSCAAVRRIWSVVTSERSRGAIELIERYADGNATEDERREAEYSSDDVYDVPCDSIAIAVHELTHPDAQYATVASVYAAGAMADLHNQQRCDEETAAQVLLLRDIFGNPFRPVALDRMWVSPTIVQLARTIYDERAFDRMPELADVLTAGCTNDDILEHCRGPVPHARGCWVVDLLLGKK